MQQQRPTAAVADTPLMMRGDAKRMFLHERKPKTTKPTTTTTEVETKPIDDLLLAKKTGDCLGHARAETAHHHKPFKFARETQQKQSPVVLCFLLLCPEQKEITSQNNTPCERSRSSRGRVFSHSEVVLCCAVPWCAIGTGARLSTNTNLGGG